MGARASPMWYNPRMVTIEERVSNLETEFRTELRHLATKADLNELRTEFRTGQGELRTDIADLRTEIQASQNRLILSMFGFLIAGVAAVATIVRFLA